MAFRNVCILLEKTWIRVKGSDNEVIPSQITYQIPLHSSAFFLSLKYSL